MREILRRHWNAQKFLLKMRWMVLTGRELRLNSPERTLLEETIIPYYVDKPDTEKVLFVGCQPYTAHYPTLWPDTEYWTIDIDLGQKKYGSRHHVVDSVENLEAHFSPGYFDLIILNGVIGFGVNTLEAAERTIKACAAVLRSGGELLIGWNQAPPYNPVQIEAIKPLEQFRPNPFPPTGQWRIVCEGDLRHTYDFYLKASEAGGNHHG